MRRTAGADLRTATPRLYNARMITTNQKTGMHSVARPLPEPVRSKHVAKVAQPPKDDLGKLLELWLSELRGGYTIAGD